MEQHLKYHDVWNMITKYKEKGQLVYEGILRTRYHLQVKDLKTRMIIEPGLRNTDVLNAKQFAHAGGVWEYIQKKFLNKSEAEIVQMYMRVLQWKKNPNMSIADSLDEIEQFNFEIEDVAGIGKSFNSTMILIIFLNGLGTEWSDVISSIETSKNYNRNDILLRLRNVEVSRQLRTNVSANRASHGYSITCYECEKSWAYRQGLWR